MSSKIKVYIWLFTIVLPLLGACRVPASNWVRITPIDLYPIQLDDSQETLWGVNEYDHTLTQFKYNNGTLVKNSSVNLPSAEGNVLNLCVSKNIWIVTRDLNVWKYDLKSKEWSEEFLNYSGELRRCKSLKSGKLIFIAGEKTIIQYTDDGISVVIKPTLSEIIYDVVEDDGNQLWILVSSNGGTLYYQSRDNQWEPWKRNLGSSLFITRPNVLWSANSTPQQVQGWNLQDKKPYYGDVVFDVENGLVNNIFQDNQNKIWVVTSNNIWYWRENDPESIRLDLPWASEDIYDSAFDTDKDILYIATEDGIYFTDTANFNVP